MQKGTRLLHVPCRVRVRSSRLRATLCPLDPALLHRTIAAPAHSAQATTRSVVTAITPLQCTLPPSACPACDADSRTSLRVRRVSTPQINRPKTPTGPPASAQPAASSRGPPSSSNSNFPETSPPPPLRPPASSAGALPPHPRPLVLQLMLPGSRGPISSGCSSGLQPPPMQWGHTPYTQWGLALGRDPGPRQS